MGQLQCHTKWQRGLEFKAEVRQHHFTMDSVNSVRDPSRSDKGPSPKELVLAGICGCAGMDVASILSKMRLQIDLCEVNGQTQTSEGPPSIFKTVHLDFKVKGPDVKPDQVLKAVKLSMTKYCGVSAMITEASPIVYDVFLNDEKIGNGRADFFEALKNSKT